MTYALSKGQDYWELDADFDHNDTNKHEEAQVRLEAKALQLGKDFAESDYELKELGSGLFSSDWMPYRVAFGKGLAKGAHDLRAGWQQLVDQLEQCQEDNKSFEVFGGFIEEVDSVDPELAQALLDQCAQHLELRRILVGLHPRRAFTETDLDRCMALLDDPETHAWMYTPILWQKAYADLPKARILDLAQRLLSKPNGDDVVLDALSMKLHGKEEAVDILGSALRLVGLRAAIQRLQRDHSNPSGIGEHHMECVIDAALRFDGNETKKLEWLDTIFAVVDERYGYIHTFENAIATTATLMPEAFLNRVFEGTEEEQQRRLFFIKHDDLCRSPLTAIDMDVLIEWCRSRSDISIWAPIAAGISLWSKDEGQGPVTMSESAVRLLEASPEPEAVLEAFAERVEPSSWSGSRASVMQDRADVIGALVEHEMPEIAVAAKSVSAKLVKWIEHVKVREQQEDEEREQRFE